MSVLPSTAPTPHLPARSGRPGRPPALPAARHSPHLSPPAAPGAPQASVAGRDSRLHAGRRVVRHDVVDGGDALRRGRGRRRRRRDTGSHHLVHAGDVRPRSRLGGVGERQTGGVDDAVAPDQTYRHLRPERGDTHVRHTHRTLTIARKPKIGWKQYRDTFRHKS